MTLKHFPSCHCHTQSFDSGAKPEDFIERELELGTGYVCSTDHGSLGATRRVYDLARKASLKPILGIEGYLRDDNCPILTAAGIAKDAKGTFSAFAKYFHVLIHAQDQAAYEALIRVQSRVELSRKEKHGSEGKALMTWADLEELGSFNTTMTSSCLAGMVQRHLVLGRPDLAEAYYLKMKSLCKPGNFYIELYPHVCDQFFMSAGIITFADGKEERFPLYKQLRFDNKEFGQGKLEDLARKFKNRLLTADTGPKLVAMMDNRKWTDKDPRVVVNVEAKEGFLKNECTALAPDGDLQAGCNKFLLQMAVKYGDPIIIGDDSHFAKPEQKVVQDIRLMSGGGSWRFANSYHRQSSDEAFAYFQGRLGVPQAVFEQWVDNSYAWASKFNDFTLKSRPTLPTSFYPKDTLAHIQTLIQKHGRMDWNNPVWVARLQQEIELLYGNGTIDLLPYFLIDEEVCDFFASQGKLTGPGRGSAAGLLLTYLLRITHVDPLQYKLSVDRFLTKTRIAAGKYPDIDQDLSREDRDLLINAESGWLRKRFGECFAHISVDTGLHLRSAVKDVARVTHGRVPDEIEALAKKFPECPQGVDDKDFIFGYEGSGGWVDGVIEKDPALKEYVAKYPEEWAVVQQCLGLTRQKSPHPCAFVIANEPVSNFIPMQKIGDEPVTAFTASSVEAAGGLKMDFLGLNSLDDIGYAIKLIQQRQHWTPQELTLNGKKVLAHEVVPFRGSFYSIWDLPEDQAVLRDFCEGKTETVFQFNTPAAVGWLSNFNYSKPSTDGLTHKAIDSVEGLAAFTALDRPGPLDYFVETEEGKHNMLVEYAVRARGGKATGNLPILDKLLPETYGVIVYQEQLEAVFKEIGKTTADQAEAFRRDIAKKEMKKVLKHRELFMPGATELLGKDVAEQLWQSMETFGQYGFNKSVDQDTILVVDGKKKTIKECAIGETVESINEKGELVSTEILALHDHGELEAFEVELSDGSTVTCSINHKFLTQNGMRPLYEILEQDLEILAFKK